MTKKSCMLNFNAGFHAVQKAGNDIKKIHHFLSILAKLICLVLIVRKYLAASKSMLEVIGEGVELVSTVYIFEH